MQKFILFLLTFFILGDIGYINSSFVIIGAALSALFLIIFIKKNKYIFIFSLAFLVLGIFSASISEKNFTKKYEKLKDYKKYEGFIVEKSNNNLVIKNYKENYKVSVYIYDKIYVQAGAYIVFEGDLKERQQFKVNGMNSSVINGIISASGKDIKEVYRYDIRMIPVKIKYKIINALTNIDDKGGGFTAGLIFGYRSKMDEETKNAFDEFGIIHMLSVSGFNLGIVYYFISLISAAYPARIRYTAILIVCFIYTALGGFTVSISRAFIMIVFLILAKMLNRLYDSINILSITALIMLVYNPYYIVNIGFQLSFLATFGIMILTKKIEDRLPVFFSRIKQEVSVSTAAFIITLPIVLLYNGYFSLFSIIVNVIISPLISILTIMGFITSIVFLITGCIYTLYPTVFGGLCFVKFIGAISRFNIVLYPGRWSSVFIFLYYLIMVIYFGFIKIREKNVKKYFAYAVGVVFLCSLYWNNRALMKLHFINVGQGDSIFIETPGKKSILIDTGPSFNEYSSAKTKVVPYIKGLGYDMIDALIITHFHNDHSGGIEDINSTIGVNSYITYKRTNKYKEFYEVSKGDTIIIDDVKIQVLAPIEDLRDNSDNNETSLVLKVMYKEFAALLTGDADGNVIDGINGDYDVYKLPHHGAISSFSSKMIENSNIGTAVISVGKNNFGHPSDYVIKNLNEKGIPVFRTDLNGNIIITTNGKKYNVKHD